jgi:type IV pilus biogenesis protein PilP
VLPDSTPEGVEIDPAALDIVAPETAAPSTTPEGLNVIAGSPPLLPPVRAGTDPPQADVADLAQDIAAALTTNTAQSPTADTLRPLPRPAAVLATAADIVAAQAVAANTPVLGALTVAQATAFRPRTRPAGLAPAQTPVPDPIPEVAPEVAVAPPTPAAPTGLQISPEIAAAVLAASNRPNPIVNPTALAVPVSSRPDLRPRNMDRIVARANDARARAATQVAAAAVAPQSVTPSGPTGGSVAQAATLDNAINLREVNLIGIYGGSGDRRALVRMGNGRYVRVTVGDQLDGGRVTAISAEALNYSKRGRAITLRVAG